MKQPPDENRGTPDLDFNSDGFLDLAVSGYYSNTVYVWLGNGRGGFGTPSQLGVGSNPGAVAVAELCANCRMRTRTHTGSRARGSG